MFQFALSWKERRSDLCQSMYQPVNVELLEVWFSLAMQIHSSAFCFSSDGVDYSRIDNMEITLAPSASPMLEVEGDKQCFNVFARNDDIKEHLYENFCVEIVGYDDCVLIDDRVTDVFISEDDDGKQHL